MQQEGTKGNEKQNEPFREHSRKDTRMFSKLKKECSDLVVKKDAEILWQKSEIDRLKKQVANQEVTLAVV